MERWWGFPNEIGVDLAFHAFYHNILTVPLHCWPIISLTQYLLGQHFTIDMTTVDAGVCFLYFIRQNILLLECCTWKVHCRKIACTKRPITWQSDVRGHAMLSFVEVWENLGWTFPSDNFGYRFITGSRHLHILLRPVFLQGVIIEFFAFSPFSNRALLSRTHWN